MKGDWMFYIPACLAVAGGTLAVVDQNWTTLIWCIVALQWMFQWRGQAKQTDEALALCRRAQELVDHYRDRWLASR